MHCGPQGYPRTVLPHSSSEAELIRWSMVFPSLCCQHRWTLFVPHTLYPTRDSALAVSSPCSTLSVVTPLLDLQVLLWKSAAAVNALPICLPSLTCCHYQHNRLPPSTPVSSESVRAEAGSSAFPIPKCPGRSRDEEHIVRGGEDGCLDLCTPGAFDLDSCGG